MATNGALRTQETPHFRLHYQHDSFAEQHLATLGSRLESAYGVMAGLLGLPGAMPEPIEVYLDELLEDPQHPGTPLTGGGYALPRRRTIHEVYRPDAPGLTLERSLLLVLLTALVGEQRPWPPMLIYGLLAWVLRQFGAILPDAQIVPALAGAAAADALPPLRVLLSNQTQEAPGIGYLAAIHFTSFLIDRFGAERLRDFLRQLDPADPDSAARAVYGKPVEQLEKSWRKALISEAPSPGGIGRFLRLSLGYLQPYWPKVIEIVIYLIFSVGFGIGLARMQGLLLDRALIPRDRQALATILGVLTVAFIIVSITSLRESYLTAWVSETVIKTLRQRIFARLQYLHPGFFQTVPTGDIMSRVTSDLDAISFALTGSLVEGLRIVLTLVLALITIFLQDWKLSIIALLGTPLFFVVSRFLGPRAARASLERQERLADATATLQENLGAQPVVKAFSLQQRMIDNYVATLDRVFRASLRLTFVAGIFGLSANSIATAIQLIVLGVGSYLVIGGGLTTGTLFAFLALMAQIIGPLQSISGLLQSMQQATGAMDRVEEILNLPPAIADAPDARPIGPASREIAFNNVTFGYAENQPILQGLTLRIPAGATVAFVGPSGCGKSTALNQIMRFYDPQSGQVTFDGVDLRAATLESVRGQQGVVLQDNVLFNISVRENIRLGNLAATDAEIEAAAKAAEIHDIILNLPQGYDTPAGERGGRLSGGQRQRVAIARAIVRNPALLLLDEATSALDPRTEAAINDTLLRLARGRTTISVTHRLAALVNYDQIYVLDRGQLVEQGTHAELVARGGLYARLWQDQGGAATPSTQQVGVAVARLEGVPMLAQLGPQWLNVLAQRLFTERYAAGDLIVQEGEIGDKLYLLHQGQVEVLATDPAGRQRPVAVLHEGDHFGEMALLYDLPRTASIRARTPVQVFSLNKEDFNDLLTAVPTLREWLERAMVERVQASAGASAPR